MATFLLKPVTRVVVGYKATLIPQDANGPARIRIVEAGRRTGAVEVPIGTIYCRAHREHAGIAVRRAKVKSVRGAR